MIEKFKLCKYDMNFWFDDKTELELIKEVDFEPEIGLNLEIGGQIYHVCALFPNGKIAGLKLIELDEEPEDEYDENFKCPYCKNVHHDAFELSEDEDTIECPTCGSEIEYTREYTVTYNVSAKTINAPWKI